MHWLALLISLLLSSPAIGAPIQAVASFSILGDMVKAIGGDRVEVTTIVGANADTHVYEPKPSDAAAVARAQIFFVNGLGFEGWMDRFVQATGYRGPLVIASQGVTPRDFVDDGVTVTDPHAWQSLSNGLIYVRNIRTALCRIAPSSCGAFTASAQDYSEQILALDVEVRAAVATVPPAERKVITTHDAFGYFGAAYGVSFLAPEGISTDAEPSAAGVARLIEQIRSTGVKALFIENMTDPRLIEQIANETGITVRGELYADALSFPGRGAGSYLEMFRHNIGLLVPAMKGD